MISMDCENYFVVNTTPRCYGTKDAEMCCCDGDARKCDFFPEKRERATNWEKVTADPKEIADACVAYRDSVITHNEFREALGLERIEEPRILDSGNRREFESGAVRDIQEGKGRCDLLPLDVVADIYGFFNEEEPEIYEIFYNIFDFQKKGDVTCLQLALDAFDYFGNYANMFLEVAKHFEEGCKKYGENNWQKGIPVHCYIDSGVRHYLKFLRGDKDEPHDRAFCWNLMCAIWTCKHKPELNEYAKREVKVGFAEARFHVDEFRDEKWGDLTAKLDAWAKENSKRLSTSDNDCSKPMEESV